MFVTFDVRAHHEGFSKAPYWDTGYDPVVKNSTFIYSEKGKVTIPSGKRAIDWIPNNIDGRVTTSSVKPTVDFYGSARATNIPYWKVTFGFPEILSMDLADRYFNLKLLIETTTVPQPNQADSLKFVDGNWAVDVDLGSWARTTYVHVTTQFVSERVALTALHVAGHVLDLKAINPRFVIRTSWHVDVEGLAQETELWVRQTVACFTTVFHETLSRAVGEEEPRLTRSVSSLF